MSDSVGDYRLQTLIRRGEGYALHRATQQALGAVEQQHLPDKLAGPGDQGFDRELVQPARARRATARPVSEVVGDYRLETLIRRGEGYAPYRATQQALGAVEQQHLPDKLAGPGDQGFDRELARRLERGERRRDP